MSYEDKYLKYKNKYLSLKEDLIGGNGELKVLIVVDVQECFLNGTMGNTNKELVTKYKERIFNFVNKEKDKYDVIVFTKDNHPQHHMSSGLYFPHCVEPSATYCGKVERELEISNLYKTSYMSTIRKDDSYTKILQEDIPNKKGKTLGEYNGTSFEETYRYNTKIQLEQQFLECTSTKKNLNELDLSKLCLNPLPLKGVTEIKLKPVNPIKITNIPKINQSKPYIIRMNKGELCNFDAYGAFAYHVSYQQKNGKLEEVDIVHNTSLSPSNLDWKKLSTGLAEFLINKENYSKNILPSNLNIDVCGLVTNICVVSTCVTGCKVFDALNFKNYKFNILNENCLNLLNYTITNRNAQKIINDNSLETKISINDGLSFSDFEVNGFNPKEEFKKILISR